MAVEGRRVRLLLRTRVRLGRDRRGALMRPYVARIQPNYVRVFRIDEDRARLVDTIPLPTGVSLRRTLVNGGWRPTGRKARGGWGAIFVTPAEDRPHPTPITASGVRRADARRRAR